MEKYKVELTGHTRYFSVEDEEGNEFSVIEFYDENSQYSDWEVTDANDRYANDGFQKIGDELKKEIINAVLNRR